VLLQTCLVFNEAGSTSSIIIDLKISNCPDNNIYSVIEKMALLISILGYNVCIFIGSLLDPPSDQLLL
jgi:Na+/H+ antiporter NhaA